MESLQGMLLLDGSESKFPREARVGLLDSALNNLSSMRVSVLLYFPVL